MPTNKTGPPTLNQFCLVLFEAVGKNIEEIKKELWAEVCQSFMKGDEIDWNVSDQDRLTKYFEELGIHAADFSDTEYAYLLRPESWMFSKDE